MARPWTWKTLAEKDAARGAQPPVRRDIVLNPSGDLVRYQKPRAIKSAIERFFEALEEIETEAGTCWRWTASDQFWVERSVVMSPWRYSYELHVGRRVPRGANFQWHCKTPRCCLPEHLELIGKYCQRKS